MPGPPSPTPSSPSSRPGRQNLEFPELRRRAVGISAESSAVEFGNCGAVLAGYGLWLQELEVGSLVVDAFGDAAIGLLLWLTGVATMATDGGEGGGQGVDLVTGSIPGVAAPPCMPAAGKVPSICQPSATRPGRKVQPSTALIAPAGHLVRNRPTGRGRNASRRLATAKWPPGPPGSATEWVHWQRAAHRQCAGSTPQHPGRRQRVATSRRRCAGRGRPGAGR